MNKRYLWLSCILIIATVLAAVMPNPSYAQQTQIEQKLVKQEHLATNALQQPSPQVASQSSTMQVIPGDERLDFTWPGATAAAVDAVTQLPTMRYQGYELPMQLFPVFVDRGSASTINAANVTNAATLLEIQTLTTTPWQGQLDVAPPLQPTVIDWQSYASSTLPAETVALPTAPFFLLRQGLIHGEPVAIWAFTPLYQDGSGIRLVTNIAATLHDVTTFEQNALTQFATAASMMRQATGSMVEPTNPDAARQAIKLTVTAPGMQLVTGAQLADAGLDLTTVNPALLQLKWMGSEVAMEIEGLNNGRLTATATIHFYVPSVGDRWNTTATYWLTVGTTPGVRMATRSVAPNDATARNSAVEHGLWSDPKLYDSRYAGADHDHWFYSKLISSQNNTSTLETVTIDVATKLPRIDGTATYTLALTTNVRGLHTIHVLAGNQTKDLTWNSQNGQVFDQDWQRPFSTTVKSATVELALVNVVATTTQSDPTVLLDKVFWEQPVELALQQGGAAFSGVPGTWRYNWSGLPANYRFYDVTNPATPMLLTGTTTTAFQDGPTAHDYLVTAPATLQKPTVTRHMPVTFTNGGANAIYIAPAVFLNALEPLLQLRRDQGYQVTAVDVQSIYDGWNYGQVTPEAIRTFLRYANAAWTPTPYSVVLIGDGTWDPHNYEGKTNTDFIPPYLARVDPWLGEAACENCYVQLDGDDPLTGDNLQLADAAEAPFFSIDMWLGRLPVKSTQELTNVINKLISYESAKGVELWQNNAVFVADNYVRQVTDDGDVVIDLAGDFAKYSDSVAALSPAAVKNERIYYDPYPQISDPDGKETWRITDAAQAFHSVLRTLSAGAGIVVYNGHSHQWQWAVTDENATASPDYLLGLYDADTLTNRNRYYINLSMTCLTSQFPKPAQSGTVLDERLLLNPNGGAIAVWGPAGLSVAYGHDFLQRGFFDALWQAPAGTMHLGELIEAGYTKLLTEDSCCQDTAKTFLLLGDPLTKARAYPDKIDGIYIPTIRR